MFWSGWLDIVNPLVHMKCTTSDTDRTSVLHFYAKCSKQKYSLHRETPPPKQRILSVDTKRRYRQFVRTQGSEYRLCFKIVCLLFIIIILWLFLFSLSSLWLSPPSWPPMRTPLEWRSRPTSPTLLVSKRKYFLIKK